MGLLQSIPQKDQRLNIFQKETSYVNGVLDKLMKNKKNNEYYDEELNFLQNSDLCQNFTVALESSLQKHLKVELKELNTHILLIPHDKVDGLKKDQLCSLASEHFTRLLQFISLIQTVYDLENNGNSSILGICLQLVQYVPQNDTMSIFYCDGKYQSNANALENSVDLTRLPGLDLLYTHFLDDMERKNLVHNLQNIFYYATTPQNNTNTNTNTKENKRGRKHYVHAMFCGDYLLSGKDYEDIFHADSTSKECNKITAYNEKEKMKNVTGTRVQIKGKNPIFVPICTNKRRLDIQFSEIGSSNASKLKQMYAVMFEEYKKHMDQIYKLLQGIVVYDATKKVFTLKHIDSEELIRLRLKGKKLVLQFYFKSLVHYQNILDFALSLKNKNIYV